MFGIKRGISFLILNLNKELLIRGTKMVIKCKKKTNNCDPLVLPRDPSKIMCESNFVCSCEWYTIDSDLSGYNITIGKKYTVNGCLIFSNQIRYLISDDNNIPGFFPYDLFEIIESYIVYDWEINIYEINSKKLVVLGCSDLFSKYDYLIDLVDNDPKAIKKYLDSIVNEY